MNQNIPQVGSFSNIPSAKYHSWLAASNSLIKVFDNQSPAHAYLKMTQLSEATDAQRFGDLFHKKILEPEFFNKTYIPLPKLDKRKKEDKAELERLVSEYGESRLVDLKLWEKLESASQSLTKNPNAMKLIESLYLVEHSLVFHDERSKALCKARLDGITKKGIIVDLKTTESAAKMDFAKSVYNFGYHTQAAHYLRAARALEIEVNHFVIIAIEKETGFSAFYELDTPTILAGENQLNRILPIWKRCVDTGVWPSYPTEIQMLNIPSWAINQLNEKTIGES